MKLFSLVILALYAVVALAAAPKETDFQFYQNVCNFARANSSVLASVVIKGYCGGKLNDAAKLKAFRTMISKRCFEAKTSDDAGFCDDLGVTQQGSKDGTSYTAAGLKKANAKYVKEKYAKMRSAKGADIVAAIQPICQEKSGNKAVDSACSKAMQNPDVAKAAANVVCARHDLNDQGKRICTALDAGVYSKAITQDPFVKALKPVCDSMILKHFFVQACTVAKSNPVAARKIVITACKAGSIIPGVSGACTGLIKSAAATYKANAAKAAQAKAKAATQAKL